LSTGYSTIDAGRHKVLMGDGAMDALARQLAEMGPAVRLFVLGDENSLHHCLNELHHLVPRCQEAETLSVPAGEASKSLQCAQELWHELAAHAADRQALLINLGGGVVSDLGGFVAGAYKRGIRTINIPTTLMGMVDAAIGGKNGIDLGGVKNIVGLFHDPMLVCVHVPFLRTLGKREVLNGIAEMIKHALVRDAAHWEAIAKAPLHDLEALAPLIHRSAAIKAAIVKEDPRETGVRKLLNFGHTIGHGIEAHSWESPHRALLHGEAIAMGMVCETWLSWRMGLLDRPSHDAILAQLFALYRPYPIDSTGHHRILELMRNDKKNSEGQFRMTLLAGIGTGQVDVRITAAQVQEALEHYRSLVRMGGKVEG
jgi:3-dehydroquinate synthase